MSKYKRYAIIIGSNNYADNAQLEYSLKDAKDIKDVLIKRCLFESENIHLILFNNKSTDNAKDELLKAFEILNKEIKSNDTILFYYSGHGEYNKTTNKSYLKVSDKEKIDIQFVLDEIQKLKSYTKYMIVDACESGGNLNFDGSKGIDKKLRSFSYNSKGIFCLFGASISTPAYEPTEGQTEKYNIFNGILTHFFLEILNDKNHYIDKILPFGTINDYVSLKTQAFTGFKQIPVTHNVSTGIHHLGKWTGEENEIESKVSFSNKSIQEQLLNISNKNLEHYKKIAFRDDSFKYTARTIYENLENNIYSNYQIDFLVGESGYGKSTVLIKLFEDYIKNDGCAILLTHDDIKDSKTLGNAIIKVLKEFQPDIDSCAAQKILSQKNFSKPVLIIIDDINNQTNTIEYVKKIVGWISLETSNDNPDQNEMFSLFHIVCPLLPKTYDKIYEDFKSYSKINFSFLSAYNDSEAMEIIKDHNPYLSNIEINTIIQNLNYDPFLISLWLKSGSNNFSQNDILESFIKKRIKACISLDTFESEDEYLEVINEIGYYILINKVFNPSFLEIKRHFKDNEEFNKINKLLTNGSIFKIDSESKKLIYRHDRIRNYILACSILHKIIKKEPIDGILSEPYYAEFIGWSLIFRDIDRQVIDKVKTLNPLSLFYSFQYNTAQQQQHNKKSIDDSILSYLGTLQEEQTAIQYEIILVLKKIDSVRVKDYLNKIYIKNTFVDEALFRNDDLIAGCRYCLVFGPDTIYSYRDSLIEHIYKKYHNLLIDGLSKLLIKKDISKELIIGALNLSGFLGSTDLTNSIVKNWTNNVKSNEMFVATFWALSRCCEDNIETSFESIIDYWMNLSDEEKIYDNINMPSDNFAILHFSLGNVFYRLPPRNSVVKYLINIARSNNKLDHPIRAVILDYVTSSEAIEFKLRRLDAAKTSLSSISDPLGSIKLLNLSTETVNNIFTFWNDEKESVFFRKQAFVLWNKSEHKKDLNILRNIKTNSPFYREAIKSRILLGDITVDKELAQIIVTSKDNYFWLQYAHYCWSEILFQAVDSYIKSEIESTKKNDELYRSFKFLLIPLLMRIPLLDTEKYVIKYWNELKNKGFFLVALFVGSKQCLELVKSYFDCTKDKCILLKDLSQIYGFIFTKSSIYINEQHLNNLETYLNYLDNDTISCLSNFCNRNGYTLWREQNIDLRLIKNVDGVNLTSKEAAIEGLNKLLSSENTLNIYSWVREFKNNKEIVDILDDWLKCNKCLDAFNLVAEILSEIGTRKDLYTLESVMPSIEDDKKIMVYENVKYTIYRRTLY